MLNRVELSQNFASMLSSSRNSANVSQAYMAQALGKSKNTISNWESGVGCPDFITLLEWFHILNINPLKYLLSIIEPKQFNNFTTKGNINKIEDTIIYYIKNVASDLEKQQLAYNIFGENNLSWNEQLNFITANNKCSERSKLNVLQMIYNNYIIEEHTNEISNQQITINKNLLSDILNNTLKTYCNNK